MLIDKVGPLDMPLAPGYQFAITQAGADIRIVLQQRDSGQSKVFRQRHGTLINLGQHMRSLTDTQCADWFKAPRARKA